MQPTDLTSRRRAWAALARQLPDDLLDALIEAAEDIADGRTPKPYRKAPDPRPTGRA
jgi:hypothetical protein